MIATDSHTQSNPAPLVVGVPQQASFGDYVEDWFSVSLIAGVTYQFALQGAQAGAGTFRGVVDMYLHDANGNYIPNTYAQLGDEGNVASLPFTPDVSGAYLLKASGYGDGSYTMVANIEEVDDFGSSQVRHGVLAVDGSADGRLALLNDRDWFAVSLTAGQLYQFTLDGRAGSPQSGMALTLFNGSGEKAFWNTYANTDFSISGSAPASGTYYLEVQGRSGRPDYTIRAAALADDFGSAPSSSGAIAPASVINGTLEAPNDRDWFALEAVAGQGYVFEAQARGGALDDLTLTIIDAVSGRPTYLNGRPFFPAKGGLYYLQVSGDNVGSYTVSMAKPADDYGNDVLAGHRIVANQPLAGKIEYAGDIDYFSFEVESGFVYKFDIAYSGEWVGMVTRPMDRAVRLTSLASGMAPAGTDSTTYRANGSGQIEVYMSAAGQASYTVSATVLSTDDHADANAGSSTLAPGTAVGGQIEHALDLDIFRMAVEAGKSYIVQGSGQLAGNALLIGASLSTAYNYSPASAAFKFVAPHTGDVFVRVSAADKALGSYSVTASVTADDDLAGTLNGSRIDGGAGLDSVRYSGSLGDHRVLKSGADFRIVGVGARSDTLVGIERVFFNDHGSAALALDIDGVGGAAYRLYQAAFDRTPDRAGVGFWIRAMDQGMSLRDVAASFVASAEFASLYGAASTNAEFVARLYLNVLNRPGEQAGMDYWLKALDGGYGRAETLANFSESDENVDAVAQLIGNGFAYIPYGG